MTWRGETVGAMLLLALLAGGCTRALGYAGMHPGYVKCQGKGTLTGSGQSSLTMIGGGAGQNTFTLIADCGDGFTLEQGAVPAPAAK